MTDEAIARDFQRDVWCLFGLPVDTWIWRIIQEPKLFTRYTADGPTMLKFVFPRMPLLLKHSVQRMQYRQGEVLAPSTIYEVMVDSGIMVLRLPCCLQSQQADELRQIITDLQSTIQHISLDFGQTVFADSAFCGRFALLQHHCHKTAVNMAITNCHYIKCSWMRLFCLPFNNCNERCP